MVIDPSVAEKLITLALEEDKASNDVTSILTVSDEQTASARVVAREELVICGSFLVAEIYKLIDPELAVSASMDEGRVVSSDHCLAEVSGNARSILAGERTVLNFLQRMCGVATFTRDFIGDTNGIDVLDTRKTTPGWRILEKYAVTVGGGKNHRESLADMILVKDNHIDANGGSISNTLKRIQSEKPEDLKVEVEVRSINELTECLEYDVDRLMLDNMTNEQIREAVQLIRATSEKIVIEASGGVTKERLQSLEETGIDCVSVGALTTQSRNVDIAMEIDV